MGCIITRDLDYEAPPNVAASVEGSAETPTNQIRVVDKPDDVVTPDGGVSQNVDFTAVVHDVNVNQDLVGLVFIDYNDNTDNDPAMPEFPIPPSTGDDPMVRRVPFSIPVSDLTLGCHTVQLHVSERFVDFSNPRPADETDLGVGNWFVTVIDSSNPETLTGCDTYRYP